MAADCLNEPSRSNHVRKKVLQYWSQRDATTLTRLGSRIFAIGGWQGTEVIEELNYADKSWSEVPHKLITRRFGHSTLVLPARLFSHLPNGCKGVM